MNMWSFGVILEINKEIHEMESFLKIDLPHVIGL
jgi:hypothetical protein